MRTYRCYWQPTQLPDAPKATWPCVEVDAADADAARRQAEQDTGRTIFVVVPAAHEDSAWADTQPIDIFAIGQVKP